MKKSLKLLVNLIILLVVVGFVWYLVQSQSSNQQFAADIPVEAPFDARFKQTSSFNVPDEIIRFGLYENETLFVAAGEFIYIYNLSGSQTARFHLGAGIIDVTVYKDEFFVLYQTKIEVYNIDTQQLVRQWTAHLPNADHCSFTVAAGYVFVTDAGNKNFVRYAIDGEYIQTVISPNQFVIPSFSFDIEAYNDTLYLINSGRHLIERYTIYGQYVDAWGKSGSDPGRFIGCCNPNFISFTPDGDLITSEKGVPRVSLYTRNGEFEEVLLVGSLLSGNAVGDNRPYQTIAVENKLIVAGRNRIMIFTEK
jgi:hypothetical protein